MVSYVQKSKLGGKSYAPTQDHPFASFEKPLTDLVHFMEKMQNRVEEEKSPVVAVKKLVAALKSRLASTPGVEAKKAERVMDEIVEMAERSNASFPTASHETPKRSVGCGGSLAGRANLKVFRNKLINAFTIWTEIYEYCLLH